MEPERPTAAADSPAEFPCDNCGARMRWDPAADALHCEYCESTVPVPRKEGTIVERALEDVGEAARGLGLEVLVSKCSTCGARVSYDGASTSENCVYCGSANVLSQAANRNVLRPESVIPLDVSRQEVQTHFQRWIRGLWFRPNALRSVARFEAVGIYVPFWTFDCHVHSDWTADAGYYYYVTETYTTRENGRTVTKTRQVRKVRWVPAWGERDDHYDDHLVHASLGLPEELVAKLGGFQTEGLVPYRPEYLAGWRAEEYQVELEAGWESARRHVEERQRERCSGDVPGDTQRHLGVHNRISHVRWKHVLLPIWSLQYKYGGETYTVLVNGQSGTIAGKAPYSWVKITLAVVATALAGSGIFALITELR